MAPPLRPRLTGALLDTVSIAANWHFWPHLHATHVHNAGHVESHVMNSI